MTFRPSFYIYLSYLSIFLSFTTYLIIFYYLSYLLIFYYLSIYLSIYLCSNPRTVVLDMDGSFDRYLAKQLNTKETLLL